MNGDGESNYLDNEGLMVHFYMRIAYDVRATLGVSYLTLVFF